jgi:hypothetical protein
MRHLHLGCACLSLGACLLTPAVASPQSSPAQLQSPVLIEHIETRPAPLVGGRPMTVLFSTRHADGQPVTEGSVFIAFRSLAAPFTQSGPYCSVPAWASFCDLAAAPGASQYEMALTYVQANGQPQMETQVRTRVDTIQEPIYQFAEGATGPLMDTYLLIANPSSTLVPTEIRFFPEATPPFAMPLELPPRARVTLKLDDLPGLEQAVFAWEVRSPTGRALAVERAVYFAMDDTGRPAAAHVVAGVTPEIVLPRHPVSFYHTRTDFTLAEGTNRGPFQTYLLLGNPSAYDATITLRFLREGLPVVERTVTIPPGRTTLDTAAMPELDEASFAIHVYADARIMAERAQYLRGEGGQLVGGLASQGQSQSLFSNRSDPNHRYFAEGATTGSFRTYLLLTNQTRDVVIPSVSYHTATGHVIVRTHPLAPGARISIDVASQDPELANTTFWIETDGPVSVERSMYWERAGDGTWTEGHLSSGTDAPRTFWLFAEGATGGAWGAQTYLLLANPGAIDSVVTVTYLRGVGHPVERSYVVPARQRLTVAVQDDPGLVQAEFGMVVTSTQPVVAERSLYWTFGGPSFVGGTCEAGQPVP